MIQEATYHGLLRAQRRRLHARAFDAATELLEASVDKEADDWVEAWLDLQHALTSLCYWRNEPEPIAAVLARVRPVVEARGTARQKANFYTGVGVQRFRASRYLIDESSRPLAAGRAARLRLTPLSLREPVGPVEVGGPNVLGSGR
jgi:hypothetical protein